MSDLNLISFKIDNKIVIRIITNATEHKIKQILTRYMQTKINIENALKRDNFLFLEIKKSDIKMENDIESLYFNKITIEV
jgi:hypothetical protein